MNKLTILFFVLCSIIIYAQDIKVSRKKIKSKTVWEMKSDTTKTDSTKSEVINYNKKGKVIMETGFTIDDKPVSYKPTKFDVLNKDIKTKYQNNEKGLIVVEIKYKKDSSLVQTTYYKYDDKNRIIEEKWSRKNYPSKVHYTYFKYDDKNNLIEKKLLINDYLDMIIQSTYNMNNEEIESKHFVLIDGKMYLKSVFHYSYEYW
jgi:hypothetical protein